MHFKRSGAYEESWAAKLRLFAVIAQDVTNILAEEALDTLAELLDAIDIALVHLPRNTWSWAERRNLFVNREIPGDVSHEILDDGEGLHGEDGDGLIERKRV